MALTENEARLISQHVALSAGGQSLALAVLMELLIAKGVVERSELLSSLDASMQTEGFEALGPEGQIQFKVIAEALRRSR